ncbi:MAG: PAS domain-containing protein, partial [Desulfobacterales bacterium]|nr:PAS domain-containing protein [Desulfobacterales bacterium]
HLHKYYLVEAEYSRALGQDRDAGDYYDKAIALAEEHEYIQEKALASELAADFYLSKDRPQFAEAYLRDAHYAYRLWGAKAKVQALEKRHPRRLFQKQGEEEPALNIMSSTDGTSTRRLDIEAVLKASRALSEEIVLDKLLKKMMRIVIENAGAEKGLLLLPHREKWCIEAEGYMNRSDVRVLRSISIEAADGGDGRMVCNAIVNYVVRTRESVILYDAAHEGSFVHDPYMVENRPRSVLCMPFMNRGKIVGILYLENNLVAGAFTSGRLEVLDLLSSQMAISVENALLYNTLEQKVDERTAELNASRELFSTFMDYLPAPVFIKDEDGRTLYVNRRFEEYFGAGGIGKTSRDLFDESLAEEMVEADRAALARGVDERIETVPRTDGEERIFHTTKFRIGQADQSIRLGGFGMDITALKQTEAELLRAKEAAEAANRAKSAFLANMSHELRSPLNTIIGFSRLIHQAGTLDPEQRDHLSIIQRGGEHLLALIDNVLDMSKIEADRTIFEETRFDLFRMQNELLDMLGFRANRKGLSLRFERDSRVPGYIETDENKLRQVLVNLIGNAINFTREGGVVVRIREGSDSPDKPDVRFLHFEIEDTGPGILPDEMDALFKPFVQTRIGRRAREGTGLRLPISGKYVLLLGGDIEIRSEAGQGATFVFDIPVHVADKADVESETPSRRAVSLEPGQPRYKLL